DVSPSMVKYIRQSSLIRACQRPVRSSYFFARREGWRRSRRRFVSCLPKAFWTSGGLAIRLAANGSVSTARMGFHGLHCGAGRFEWPEDPPRLHRRVRLLELPCQTHCLVDENLLQAPRENARDGASGNAGVRGQLCMREASSIDLPQDSHDELCFEDCLEAGLFRDAEELGQNGGAVTPTPPCSSSWQDPLVSA